MHPQQNKRFLQEAQRLEEIRRHSSTQGVAQYRPMGDPGRTLVVGSAPELIRPVGVSREDPLIYPGLYAPSGFDMMGILIRVRQRPNPTIQMGNIDHSVCLVLCDLEASDLPIIYCSETFSNLTGYTNSEILGRNCRFLQYPPSSDRVITRSGKQMQEIWDTNGVARAELKEKIARGEEAQVRLINFKKSGEMFNNILTVIPITWDDDTIPGRQKKYLVGFQGQVSEYRAILT